jgi:hypothetical protein
MTRFRNVLDAPEYKGAHESRLNFWKKNSGYIAPVFCPISNCLEKAEVGAIIEVQKDSKLYILPLCKYHSKSSLELAVIDTYKVVPAEETEVLYYMHSKSLLNL